MKGLNVGSKDSLKYIAYCQVYIDREGILREIKVTAHKGSIDVDEIKDFFQGLKFDKLKRMGYGIDLKCIIPIRKNKN